MTRGPGLEKNFSKCNVMSVGSFGVDRGSAVINHISSGGYGEESVWNVQETDFGRMVERTV